MDNLKSLLISTLRDQNTGRAQFRHAALNLAEVLAFKASEFLNITTEPLQTPIAKTQGTKLKNNIMLVPILRSGLALLPAFLKYFPDAPVGIVGLRRDEKTAIAQLYYNKVPKINSQDQVIILDPMIATGGTAEATLNILQNMGVQQERIIFVSIVCAPQGLEHASKKFPGVKFIVAVKDENLTPNKFITPGLGDFGDRFFGTE
jgi:uracil phosphoribosyltransferase